MSKIGRYSVFALVGVEGGLGVIHEPSCGVRLRACTVEPTVVLNPGLICCCVTLGKSISVHQFPFLENG